MVLQALLTLHPECERLRDPNLPSQKASYSRDLLLLCPQIAFVRGNAGPRERR